MRSTRNSRRNTPKLTHITLWNGNGTDVVTLPKEFVATKYPGYFWNIKDEKLYSIKVTGMLRPLAFQKPNRYNHYIEGYKVSVNGQKRVLFLDYLKKLTPKRQQIPIYDAVQLALF